MAGQLHSDTCDSLTMFNHWKVLNHKAYTGMYTNIYCVYNGWVVDVFSFNLNKR